jgi:hypothetical protein
VLRVMREAPISGRYSLIDLLVCMIYDICFMTYVCSAVRSKCWCDAMLSEHPNATGGGCCIILLPMP